MELPFGIRRITTPLPTRPGHVHSYLLPGDDGWTLVDTGIGLPNAQEVWAESLGDAEVSLAAAREHYAREIRWPDAPFWRRRQTASYGMEPLGRQGAS